MIIELFLLKKENTDTLIEQTKTKPQETLEFKLNKQMQTFSFNLTNNLLEERKWLLADISVECTMSVFNIINENSSFSIILPGQCQNKPDEKTIFELNKLLEIMSFELHVKEVRKRENNIKIGDSEYILTTVILLENWQQEFRVLISFNTSDARTVVCVRYSLGLF